jgi:hypothetical protein
MDSWEYAIVDISGLGKDIGELNRKAAKAGKLSGWYRRGAPGNGGSCTLLSS